MASDDKIQVLHGDCLEVMAGMHDASVDAVVTDPPYGTASPSKVQTHSGKVCGAFNIGWDADLPVSWYAEAARVLKPGGSLISFTDNREVGAVWAACEAAGLRPLQLVFWHKNNPPPQPRKNFQSAVESAVFARKPGTVLAWNGGGATQNIFKAPIVGGKQRTGHPTQKPLDLMRWLVRLVTPPGGLVLDPFAGSGTTGVAALQEGLRAILIEREQEYVEIIRARCGLSQPAPVPKPEPVWL